MLPCWSPSKGDTASWHGATQLVKGVSSSCKSWKLKKAHPWCKRCHAIWWHVSSHWIEMLMTKEMTYANYLQHCPCRWLGLHRVTQLWEKVLSSEERLMTGILIHGQENWDWQSQLFHSYCSQYDCFWCQVSSGDWRNSSHWRWYSPHL